MISKMGVETTINSESNLIPLSEASKKTGYTPEYLNFLSRKGLLVAKKIGRNWYTTEVAVNDFVASRSEQKAEEAMEIVEDAQENAEVNPVQSEVNFEKAEAAVDPQREIVFHWGDLGGNYSKKKGTWGKDLWTVKEEKVSALSAVSTEIEPIKAEGVEASAPTQVDRGEERHFKFSLVALAAVFAFFMVFQTVRLYNSTQSSQLASEAEAAEQINWQEGVVAGEETEKEKVMLASENFGIREIQFGGGVSLLARDYENSQLAITDVRSEIISAKTKNTEEIKMLIYWKTNKLAISDLEYSKMNGNNPRSSKEDNFGYNHSVVLSGLEPGTAYTYVIKSQDRWGNEVSSERYSAYTGARYVSVFDLIVNSIRDVFSWAIKK